MKTEQTKFIVIGCLGLVLLVTVAWGGTALSQAKSLTTDLKSEVDSLRTIAIEYDELSKSYEQLYEDMKASREHLSDIKLKVKTITERHSASLATIQGELEEILNSYDSLNFTVAIDTASINSLKF